MEPTRAPQHGTQVKDEDVDLGQLFHQTGGIVNNFFTWLARVFSGIGTFLLHSLFFLRRNLLWLLLGTVVGMAFGLYSLSKNGSKFNSDMTVRTNFNSSRSLYGTIDLLNAQISNGQTAELAHTFNITPAEAKTLVYFEVNPIKSEMITAELYKEKFLLTERNPRLRLDTFWVNTIKYPAFKSSLTKFDYPIHEISVTSTSQLIFPKIQEGLIRAVSANALLQNMKSSGEETNKEVVALLKSSLKSLDTLRDTYNKRLISGSRPGELPGNNLTVMGGPAQLHVPELDLYDKLLELKDELRLAKNQEVIENDIIQVYSPFGTSGYKESFFRQSVVSNGILAFFATLIILSLIALYKYLKKLEQEWTARRSTAG